jgi:phenylpropionate dioxygenase-like ring-hydroxylating dioxygenase large terminal subunit
MFLKNCWYVAGWSSDVVAGEIFAMTIINEPLIIYRGADGGLIALQNRCCHRQAPLSMGRLEGECVRCLYHGLKFDPNGVCIEIPGQDVIPPRAKIAKFAVVERNDWIWVWMGAPDRADHSLIPNAISLDDPNWDLRKGQMDYNVNYELVNDNLTDFSHLSFVHVDSFGASPSFAAIRPKVKRIDRGVRISRWMTGGASENKNVAGAVGRSADVPVSYMSYDYLVPGILLMRNQSHRIENYPEDGVSAPTGTPVKQNVTCQAVTPMTNDTTRYFFTTGPQAGPNSHIGAEKLLEITSIAFREDRDMIEAQARMIKNHPGHEIATTADVALVQFRAILRRLIHEETAQETAAAPSDQTREVV